MALPAMLYVTFLEPGLEIRWLRIAAALAKVAMEARMALMGGVVAVPGRVDPVQDPAGRPRGHGARGDGHPVDRKQARIRGWRGGDVRGDLLRLLGVVVVWGIVALKLAQPILLLQIRRMSQG